MKNTPAFRNAHLEFLRAIGAYLVVICHTMIYIQLNKLSPISRFLTFYLQSFSKIAVPLFLMVSGCTLLPKTDSFTKTMMRVLRIAASLLFFSLVYEFLHLGSNALTSFSITSFLDALYRNPIIVPYWYLYTYTGLLLMLPILQKLVKSMTRSDYIYFFSVSFLVFGVCPLLVEYTPLSEYTSYFALPLFSTHICYMLMGYVLSRIPKSKFPIPALLAVLVLSLAANAFLMYRDYAASSGAQYRFMDNIAFLPMLLASASFFLLVHHIPLNQKTATVICSLGSCAFGVYLLSDLFLITLIPAFYTMRSSFGQIPATLLYQLIVFIASILLTALLKRMPLLRKLL